MAYLRTQRQHGSKVTGGKPFKATVTINGVTHPPAYRVTISGAYEAAQKVIDRHPTESSVVIIEELKGTRYWVQVDRQEIPPNGNLRC